MGSPAALGATLGLFSALVLFALFAAALILIFEPLILERDPQAARAILWLGAIAIAKLALLPSFPGYWSDVRCWNLWSAAMAAVGPTRIYEPQFVCDYPPGYLYVLWLAGFVSGALGLQGFETVRLVTEAPPILVDLLLGLTIFAAIRRLGPARWAFAGMLLFALNPALLFDTVIWGQSDSVLALPVLASALLVLEGRYELGWAMAAIAVLIKPQGLILLPVLGLWCVLETRVANLIGAAAAFVGTLMIGIAPFQIGQPWNFMFELYFSAAGRYPMTSDNAFNLIALLGGLREPDSVAIAGVSAFTFGMTLFAVAYAAAAWIMYWWRTPRALLLSILIVYLAMFTLAPRMHERYLYTAVAMAIPLAFDSPAMFAVLVAISSTFLFNLAYAKRFNEHQAALNPFEPWAGAAALINVVALAAALLYGLRMAAKAAEPGATATRRAGESRQGLAASGPGR